MATKSGYKPLPDPSTHIRLVKICKPSAFRLLACELRVFPLEDVPPYYALSYTWGAGQAMSSIKIDGDKYAIARNLYAFLKEQARSHEEQPWLWIDAICISQQSHLEKIAQIPLMGEIYSNAAAVLVWLGPGTKTTDKLLDYLDLASRDFGQDSLKEHHDELFGDGSLVVQDALQSLLRNPYWNRTWIIQEFLLAADIFICSGSRRIPWETLHFFSSSRRALYTAMNTEPPIRAYRPIFGSPAEALGHTRDLMPAKRALYLHQLLNRYKYSECTDFRDKVYGLLALAHDINAANGFQPDYTRNRLDLFFSVLECKRLHSPPPLTDADLNTGAQHTAIELCDVLGIDMKRILKANLNASIQRYCGLSSAEMSGSGFLVTMTELGEVTSVKNSSSSGIDFKFVRYPAALSSGLANTSVATGMTIYRIQGMNTGMIGYWEDDSFWVVSRYVEPMSTDKAVLLMSQVRVVMMDNGLTPSEQRITLHGSSPIHLYGKHDVRLFNLNYEQFLNSISLEQVLRGVKSSHSEDL